MQAGESSDSGKAAGKPAENKAYAKRGKSLALLAAGSRKAASDAEIVDLCEEDLVVISDSPPVKRAKPQVTGKGKKFAKLTGKALSASKDMEDRDQEYDESEADTAEYQTTVLKPRKFKRIPIFIVDYHNDVLEFLYRCMATRHLPLKNNVIVHFDSHPDMVISRDFEAASAFEMQKMLRDLSIENWIMPICFAGHFNRVIWVKNPWCEQIPVGKYDFNIGQNGKTLFVDCPLDYFVSEGNYCETNRLENSRQIEFQVYDADANNLDPNNFLTEENATNLILDIDLDFFSTANPFLEVYKDVNCYAQLTEIFKFDKTPGSHNATAERRKRQLDALSAIFNHLDTFRSLDGLGPVDPEIINQEKFGKIEALVKSLMDNYEKDEIEWPLIFDSGCTSDSHGLPHHISTEQELDKYFNEFKQFLQLMPVPPVVVTISRSAEDDYCPKNDVDNIQERVLNVLCEVFGERMYDRPIKQYLDDDWDVRDL